MKYTYLIINFASILIPLIYSFHPKLRFYKKWKSLFAANLIVSSVFIGWDVLYTHLGIWGFNSNYLLGIKVFNLPIEEIMFFICIPYASIFTYHCLGILIKKDYLLNYAKKISLLLVLSLTIAGIISLSKLYTSATFLLLATTIFMLQWIIKVTWLSRFYFSYALLLLPFFIVNGILTGWGLAEPVVIYNNFENLNLRLNTIPIEDVFYGMLLLITNIGLYEYYQTKQY